MNSTFRPDKIPLVPVPRSTAGSSSRRLNAASGVRKAGPPAAGSNRLTAASIAAPADGDGRGRSTSPVTGRRKNTSSQSARLAAGAGSFFEAVSSGWFGSGGGQGK